MNRHVFWPLTDAIAVGVFMSLLIFAAFRGDVPVAVASGFLMLFWQREYHRDVEDRP